MHTQKSSLAAAAATAAYTYCLIQKAECYWGKKYRFCHILEIIVDKRIYHFESQFLPCKTLRKCFLHGVVKIIKENNVNVHCMNYKVLYKCKIFVLVAFLFQNSGYRVSSKIFLE